MSWSEKMFAGDWPATVQSVAGTVVIAIFVVTFLVQAFTIPSESMEDTLLIGDYLLNPSQHFVKRVVGIPGDRVRIINKHVFVNGVPLQEPYVHFISPDRQPYRDDFPQTEIAVPGVTARWWAQMRKLVEDHQLIVPEDSYFALGDNRDDSTDSRYWGFVPRENIIGRPLVIYWSARNLNNDLPGSPTAGDRLYHLAYAVTHFFRITRWERTFRLVR